MSLAANRIGRLQTWPPKNGAILASMERPLSISGFQAEPTQKQDMKAAGADTKDAAKNTGNAVKTGTKKTYNSSCIGERLQQARKAPMSISGLSLPPSPAITSSLISKFLTSLSGHGPAPCFTGSSSRTLTTATLEIR